MKKNRLTAHKIARYFLTVCEHKFWAFYYGCRAGMPICGFLHDFSKFAPSEFFDMARYYDGSCSPVVTSKKTKGYSLAWLRHRGRNPHHYEFWIDNLDDGGMPLIMPKKYAKELVVDWLAANRTYNGKEDFMAEFDFWKGKRDAAKIHPVIQLFLDNVFEGLVVHGVSFLKNLDRLYDNAKFWNGNM